MKGCAGRSQGRAVPNPGTCCFGSRLPTLGLGRGALPPPPPAGGPPPPPGLPTRQAIFSIQTRQVPMPLATGILHRPYADGGRRGRREVLRFGRATEDMKGQHGSGAGAGAGASPPQAPALTSEADACHPPPAPPPLTAKRLNPTSVTISPGDQDEVPSPHCPSVSLSEKR